MRRSLALFSALSVLSVCAFAVRAADLEIGAADRSSFANSPPFVIDFRVEPEPLDAGQSGTFFFLLSKATKTQTIVNIDFGDGSTGSLDMTGEKGGAFVHTYATGGAYAIEMHVLHNGFDQSFYTTVTVGPGVVVNVFNGATMEVFDPTGSPRGTASRFQGGIVNVRNSLAGGTVSFAQTEFEDIPTRSTVDLGTQVTHTYTETGLFVVTSTINGTPKSNDVFLFGGKVRKTVGIASRDVGKSDALNPPAELEIKIKKYSGKFLFTTSDAPDAVQFSGSIQLPPGFDPARADGNAISVGLGNVTDTVTVDAKGAATGPSVKGRIAKIKVKWPKLTGALTAGGELAQFDVTYSVADLDTAGFDTDGIQAFAKSGEFFAKTRLRNVQVNLLVGGVAYDAIAKVGLKVGKPKKGSFTPESGAFKFIPTRSLAK